MLQLEWPGEKVIAVRQTIRRELIYLWYYFDVQFRQIFRYWVLGMVIGSAVSVFLKDRIHNTFRSLGEKKFARSES